MHPQPRASLPQQRAWQRGVVLPRRRSRAAPRRPAPPPAAGPDTALDALWSVGTVFVGAVLAQAVMDVATLRGQQAARAEAGGATASGASSGQLAALEAKVAGLPTGPALKQAMQDALAEALPPQLAALQAAAAARQLLALQAAAALQLAALHASVDGLEAGEEAACALREAQVKNLQAMLVAEVTEAALKAKPKPSPQQLAALQAKLGSKQVQKALHGIIDMSKTDMEEAVTELVAEAWEEVEQAHPSGNGSKAQRK